MTKPKEPPKSLDAFADDAARASYAENQRLARMARALRAENTDLRERAQQASTERDEAERALSLFERTYSDRPDWLTPKPSAKTRATVLAVLSDVHAGEIVRPAEVNDYNAYSLAICEMRLQRFFLRSIELARSWSGHEYDGAVLAMLGDLTSGDIHDELVQTNEMSTYEVVLWLVPRLCEGVEMFRKAFRRVHAASAPGNHGRDHKIPRYKGRSAHNADTLIARLVAREFAKVEGVTFEVPESIDAAVRIYRYDFSLEHGDELKSFSGSPEIGALGPLMRGTNRKRTSLAAQGKGLDYALWGHFHQLIPVPSRGFVTNGSLKGWDEYASGRKLKPEPPQQALMIVTPDYGITTNSPVLVLDRKAEQW